MSSTTSRVSLYKPAGGENVNVTTDINNNMDKIDTNLNFRVVATQTARNAISPFWEGLNVRQTDTGKLYVSNGTPPISASWTEIVQVNNRTADELLLGNLVRQQRANATDSAYESRVTGDGNARWFTQIDGKTWWGPGSGAVDTNLYRNAANELKTDDAFTATGDITTGGNVVFSANGSEKNTDLSTPPGAISNTTTETVVATYTIPANDAVAGAVYKLTAWGTCTTSTSPPTLTFAGRIGGVAGTQFGTTNAFSVQASMSNRVWKAEIYYVILTTGASGTGFGNIHVMESLNTGGTTNPATSLTHRMDGGASHTVDTTTSKDLVLTVKWTTVVSTASIQCRGYSAERVS